MEHTYLTVKCKGNFVFKGNFRNYAKPPIIFIHASGTKDVAEFNDEAEDITHAFTTHYASSESKSKNVDDALTAYYDKKRLEIVQEQRQVREIMGRLKKLLKEKYGLTTTGNNQRQNGTPNVSHNNKISTVANNYGDLEILDEEGLFQGDIRLTIDQAQRMYDNLAKQNLKYSRRKRKFTANLQYYWNSSREINYTFSQAYTKEQREIIKQALDQWSSVTCLRFTYQAMLMGNKNGLIFTPYMGCTSNVGRYPYNEPQEIGISFDPKLNCMKVGVIAHEIAHALGFWHETSRNDRSKYVKVLLNNVDPHNWEQFYEDSVDEIDNHDVPYDFGSIMHYSGKTFVNHASAFSILTKPPAFQYTIGQRDRLSFNDVKLMNKIYCSNRCQTSTKCHNGGYQHPNQCNTCLCPAGFTGVHCEVIDSDKICGSSRVNLSRKNRMVRISSPNYPRGYKEPMFCTWLIEAEDPSDKIALKIINLMDLYCDIRKMTCMDYVEVRNSTDLSNTGMRFCCMNRPEYEILSGGNKMLLMYNSFYRYGQGFDVTVENVSS